MAISDLLVGTAVDPLGAALIMKEALRMGPTENEVQVFLIFLFSLGSSSILKNLFQCSIPYSIKQSEKDIHS